MSLDARPRLETDHRRVGRARPQPPEPVLHTRVAAGKALGPQRLIQPHGGHVRIALEERRDLVGIRVELTTPRPAAGQRRLRRVALALVGMDHVGHRFPIDPPHARDGPEGRAAMEPTEDLHPFELRHAAPSKSRASAATAVASRASRANRGASTA